MATVGYQKSFVSVIWVTFKIVLWTLLVKLPLAFVCFGVSSEGARVQFESMAQKAYRAPLPLINKLQNYQWSYKLDYAHIFVLLVVVFMFIFMKAAVRIIRSGTCWDHCSEGEHFVLYTTGVLMCLDSYLFYK